ncbi:MAG: c-type cytochrome [Planctomycetes bacterium]|nr:c-type cytochrome [Planctomycetota bacterium]
MKLRFTVIALAFTFAVAFPSAPAQQKKPKKPLIPHGQSKPPNDARTPQEALKHMQVPPGFRVELVAAEPDIVNPVAMTFDERGRIWITESIEYPRRSAGPGKDRVKVLESTKGDGKFDKITTVITGLNIPSGIAVGHGGVWVANSPDILYYPFQDFAGAKLGKPQVVVTGFGRFDTHELPNSLTWGPDGWLYGLNGVFNRSVVKQDGKTFDFTCALFKIHPKTKKFAIFCEGTSNPWGLAFNDNGDAFVSACVIDHLWHLTETGYYHRQGGPYPPYTWKIGSIVKHKHQKAAYCGLCWFDSDAYPPEYREKMYMGNIHGGAINCDELTRDGSTYFAKPALRPGPKGPGIGEGSNFLLANDAWFMPVSQKVGPDGCLYILDWYDRYHCYQDANRDPKGIDRLKGRLYRVVYKDYKPAGKIDLNDEKNAKLIERIMSPNVFVRETAQRILQTRLKDEPPTSQAVQEACIDLQGFVDKAKDRKTRLHALWIIHSLNDYIHGSYLRHPDPIVRAWEARSVGYQQEIDRKTYSKLVALAKYRSPEVQLQVAIAARKFEADAMPVLLDVLTHCGDDKLIPHIVWQNLHPLLEKDGERFLTLAGKIDLAKAPGVAKVLPRAIDRILGNAKGDPAAVVRFIDRLTNEKKDATAGLCLAALTNRVQTGEIKGPALARLKEDITPSLAKLMTRKDAGPQALYLRISLGDTAWLKFAHESLQSSPVESERVLLLDALMTGHPDSLKTSVPDLLRQANPKMPTLRGQVLSRLGKASDPWIATIVLDLYPRFTPDEQAKSIELLTQRPNWAKSLFNEIASKKISKDVINVNQARRLLASKDAELRKLIEKHWGIPRNARNPERERIVAQMRELYTKTPGDPKRGAPIFKKLCAQCHKIHGEGVDVGPDITSNGRADFNQLLSNVFDPSLVIGSGYQAVTVNTKNGQTLTGLIVEDNKERVVLKVQGGELKTIARKDVDEQFTSKLSMMPEDLEKQLRPQEIVDLLAYLSLDRSPEDPKAKRIPGVPR